MAVRFKFRSSPSFDSINIGSQPSISIRDLKSEIIKKNHLNLSHDFDLLFSDSLSGQEYKDESVRIPSGSSVVIKRVPAISMPSLRADDTSALCFGSGEANPLSISELPFVNDGASALDDFGIDLSPIPDASIPDVVKLQSQNTKMKHCVVPRCSEELLVRCHNLEATLPSQSSAKESSINEGSTLVMQSKPKTKEVDMDGTLPLNHLTMEQSDMPSELKCSLCRNFFKEAVMIPCCQHSFCQKCICVALTEDAKCPKCSSTKCKAEDLLPNVSLRQAINRFLESRLLNASENDLHRFAPDGESGIQVELSYAATVTQRDLQLRRSKHLTQNKLHNNVHMQCNPGALQDCFEFQGENDPQNIVRVDEGGSCTKKDDGFHAVVGGEGRTFTAPGRLKRGLRTCYMCGSPDHLIRECPVAASSHANCWNGDTTFTGPVPVPSGPPPYWPGSPSDIKPYVNMYGGPGMMMYNATMPTLTPFAYPSYAPAMCAAYSIPSAHLQLGTGGMAPPIANSGQHPSHVKFLQDREKQHGNYNGRDQIFHQAQEFGMPLGNKGRGFEYSDDNLGRRSEMNNKSRNTSDDNTYSYGKRREKIYCNEGGRDVRFSKSDRSTSEKDMSGNRFDTREDGHDKPYRNARTDEIERRVKCGNDSKKDSFKGRAEYDHSKSDREFHSHSRSSMEHSYSSDGTRQKREESSHRTRYSKKSTNSIDREFCYDQEKKANYSEDGYEDYYHGHKRKRLH